MILNNKKVIISLILLIVSGYLLFKDGKILAQQTLITRLSGKILLQVEDNGEAWYVDPARQKRHFLGRPADAFSLMRSLGIGITNDDLAKISVAEANFSGIDSDNDGLSDALEDSFGTDKNKNDTDGDGHSDKDEILNNYNPRGDGVANIDIEKAKSLKGEIVIQIEQNGEAWYINPDNFKRYYLGRPADAFSLMRNLGLGITNKDLAKIDQYQIINKYNGNDIVQKYTKPADNNGGMREYFDPDNNYSFDYPENWSIRKFKDYPGVVHLTDARNNYIADGRAIIIIDYFDTPESNEDVAVFRMATKKYATTLSDKKEEINDNDAYENSYQHERAYEKTTTIQVSSKEFMRISLVTAKQNNDFYIGIYDDLLNSIEFAESL
jgi:hypothetical protein